MRKGTMAKRCSVELGLYHMSTAEYSTTSLREKEDIKLLGY